VHRFVSWGALPAGSLAAGAIGAALGLRTAMVTAAIVAALCFWPLLTSPLRTNAGSARDRAPGQCQPARRPG
jgi:hypothetical protein